jgi:hypothetical protein
MYPSPHDRQRKNRLALAQCRSHPRPSGVERSQLDLDRSGTDGKTSKATPLKSPPYDTPRSASRTAKISVKVRSEVLMAIILQTPKCHGYEHATSDITFQRSPKIHLKSVLKQSVVFPNPLAAARSSAGKATQGAADEPFSMRRLLQLSGLSETDDKRQGIS